MRIPPEVVKSVADGMVPLLRQRQDFHQSFLTVARKQGIDESIYENLRKEVGSELSSRKTSKTKQHNEMQFSVELFEEHKVLVVREATSGMFFTFNLHHNPLVPALSDWAPSEYPSRQLITAAYTFALRFALSEARKLRDRVHIMSCTQNSFVVMVDQKGILTFMRSKTEKAELFNVRPLAGIAGENELDNSVLEFSRDLASDFFKRGLLKT